MIDTAIIATWMSFFPSRIFIVFSISGGVGTSLLNSFSAFFFDTRIFRLKLWTQFSTELLGYTVAWLARKPIMARGP
jgi:hypothetical protein